MSVTECCIDSGNYIYSMFVCIISVLWNVLNVCGCIGGRGQCALFRIRSS